MRIDKETAWGLCVGMTGIWEYCKTGTATNNADFVARAVQRMAQASIDGDGRGDRGKKRRATCSLKVGRAVAAEIQRYARNESGVGRIGNGFGETRLF